MIKFKTIPTVLATPPAAPPAPPEPVFAPATPEPPAPVTEQPTVDYSDLPQFHLKYHLHKAIAGPREPRHHNVVHASDLDPAREWCPREPALLTMHNLKRKSGFLSTAQSTVFNFGHKGADIIIQALPPEMVWGNWKCRACNFEMNLCYTPSCCGKCAASSKALRYQEVLFRDPDTGVVGSCDLIVDLLMNGAKTLVEIKTEGNDSFKARTKADFDHEWRTRLYLYLASRTPQMEGKGLNLGQARVIYLTKEGYADDPKIKEWKLPDWAKSPFKEYRINREDSFVENQMDKAKSYRKWRNDFDAGFLMTLPERLCKNKAVTRAKNCDVCNQCFSEGPA